MVEKDIEKAVFDLLAEYNGRNLLTLKKFHFRLDTDLNQDFRMDPLDAYEFLEKYADTFCINPAEIDFQQYFPEDFSKSHDPLTVALLIESAKAGRWLGND